MKIPKLKKIESVKKYHGIALEDHYAWVDQPNILEVLKDSNKLLPDVKKYIDACFRSNRRRVGNPYYL